MILSKMTYARVAQSAAPAPMTVRPHDVGVEAFLRDHVKALSRLATLGDSPSAHFSDKDTESAFESLRTGTELEFLNAAGLLTARLIGQMDGRSAPGLLVCVRFDSDGEQIAAALKLQVVTPHAAILEALDTGEEVLSAATNVLDAPGELQKGALVRDPRPNSEVVIGDKLSNDAQYFPRAFGIRAEQKSSDAGADLLNALDLPSSTVRKLAARLPTIGSGMVEQVLDDLMVDSTEITPEIKARAIRTLEARPRPVSSVNTTVPLKEVIEAGGITVTGSVEAMQSIVVQLTFDGAWEIVITVRDEPKYRFKK